MQYDAICGYLIILLCTYIHGDTNLIDMRRVVLPTSCNRIYKRYLQTKSRFDPFEDLKALMVNRHTHSSSRRKTVTFHRCFCGQKVVGRQWAVNGPCSGGCRLDYLAQGEGMVFGILCLEMICLAPISKIDVLSWNMVLHQIFGALL